MSLLVEGVALTPSGRPVLAPEELELRMIERVDVEFGDKRAGSMRGRLQGREADKYVAGVALVTSHRLIWLDQARAPGTEGLSCSVHLSRVIEAAPVPLKSKPRFATRHRREALRAHPHAQAKWRHTMPPANSVFSLLRSPFCHGT